MNSLIRVDVTAILEILIPVLKARKDVAAAYLFGSILGMCRPDSDVDVGLLLTPHIFYTEKEAEKIQAEILEELPSIHNQPFDLVILNQSSAIFAYRVITQGRLIYTKDYDTVTDFMEYVSRKRAENYPRYRQALEAIARG